MGTSPKPTAWIGLGTVAVAALAAAYNLGRISTERDTRPQSHQNAASQNDPDPRSTLSVIQKRLASCETTLQRRDHNPQKREGRPQATEGNPAPAPEPELPKQCITALQARSLTMMAAHCRNFREHFDAYKTILGSSTIDCDTVLSIRDMARMQYLRCVGIVKVNEDADYQDAASNPLAIDAVEESYTVRGEHADIDDIDKLVNNPECLARMQTE
ncbi:hypothetical protein WME79_19640 [Sorangium sp. So ce726]|uniref:hypothetical protein n=1 Tax=Sorangium sp. So ce726 TaxID=3133319 RepID=UPI003F5F79C4